jgi:hypothetical protein
LTSTFWVHLTRWVKAGTHRVHTLTTMVSLSRLVATSISTQLSLMLTLPHQATSLLMSHRNSLLTTTRTSQRADVTLWTRMTTWATSTSTMQTHLETLLLMIWLWHGQTEQHWQLGQLVMTLQLQE